MSTQNAQIQVPKRMSLRRIEGWRPELLVMAAVSTMTLVLILYPIGMLLWGSFLIEDSQGNSVLSIANYAAVLGDGRILRSLANSLIIAAGATALAGALGTAMAWISTRTDSPGRRLFEPFLLVTFFLSPLHGAIAWTYLAAPRVGLLNQVANSVLGASSFFNVYSIFGIIWVHTLFFTPVVYMFVSSALDLMDPSLEEGARMSGKGVLQTAYLITLPLVSPSILSALIMIFVSSAGEFGVPLLLGSSSGVETLTTQVYAFISRRPYNYNIAAASGSVLMLIAMGFLYFQRRWLLPRQFTTVTGKGQRGTRIRLGNWRYLTVGFITTYVATSVLLPSIALLMVSLSPMWIGRFDISKATLNNFVVLINNEMFRMGVKNSLLLAVGGATLSVFVAFVVAYTIYKTRLRGRAILDFVTILPVGVPDIVMAAGVLVDFIKTPLYGTIFLLLVGYMSRFLPYGQRAISSAIQAVSRELEEAAQVCGAGWFKTMCYVLLPLVRPGLIAGWILLFVIYLREFSISVLLYTSGLETLSVVLYYFFEWESAPRTAALAITQLTILVAAFLLFRRLAGDKAQWV